MPKVDDDDTIKVSVPMPRELHGKLVALAIKDRRALGAYLAKLAEAHVAKLERAS